MANAIKRVAKKAKTWTHVDVDSAARLSGVHRADIVAKLNAWHDDKIIDLKTGGVVNVYCVLQKLPTKPAEKQKIIDALYKELEVREQQDLERMKEVMNLVTGSACFARTLAEHFGDALSDGRQECGHCTWCEKHKAVEKVSSPKREWDSKAFFRVLGAVPDRDDPRFLARVAFGINSPRVTQSKLGKDGVFGSMNDHNFTVCA